MRDEAGQCLASPVGQCPMAERPRACGSLGGCTLCTSVAGGGPQAALPPHHHSTGSEAQGLGPGNGIWPEDFIPLLGDCPFPLSLFPISSVPLHRVEAAPRVCSAREGCTPLSPGPEGQNPLQDGHPISPHLGTAPRQGDIQQSPVVPGQRDTLRWQKVTDPSLPAGGVTCEYGERVPRDWRQQEAKGGKERERQHTVKGSSDRPRSRSGSFPPCHSLIAAARQ